MLAFTGIQSVTVESFFAKLCPSDVAGTMKGIFNFFGQLGVVLITVASGKLYDLHGPRSTYILVGFLDLVLAILTLTLLGLGKVKTDAKSIKPKEKFNEDMDNEMKTSNG